MGMVRKAFGNVPLKDLTMERKRVEEFEESLCEDCGWVNLFLKGFSLNILAGSSLHFMGITRIYIGGKNGMWRVRFFKIELAGGLDSRLDWVASSSHEVAERLVYTFCPIVLQLAWHFNFWHAWHVCNFWRLASHSPLARSSHETLFLCTILSIFLHSLTHYPYMNPT